MTFFTLQDLTSTILFITAVTIGVCITQASVKIVINLLKINKALGAFPSMPKHMLYGTNVEASTGSLNSEFLQSLLDRVKLYPYVYRIWDGPFRSSLVLCHPDFIAPVLRASREKPESYDGVKTWIGDGLISSSGKKWLRSRHLLSSCFHLEAMKSLMSIFIKKTDIFIETLDALSKEEKPVMLFDNTKYLTMDIILDFVCSYETSLQTSGNNVPYIEYHNEMNCLWSKRTSCLLYKIFPFMYWISADGWRFTHLCHQIHEFTDNIIKRRIQLLNDEGFSREKNNMDVLDILLTAKDSNGKGMPLEAIRAEVDTLILAGSDSTSGALSWTLYLLAKHPRHQQEIQEEVDDLVNELGTDRFELRALRRMPLLKKNLKESLRIYPPTVYVARILNHDIVLDGTIVPAGTVLNIPIWSVHHNPAIWGEDHMEYKPERFDDKDFDKYDPLAFMPFLSGPRNCIGQNFAMCQLRLILARLMHRYTFTLPKNSLPPKPSLGIALGTENDIPLEVTIRSKE